MKKILILTSAIAIIAVMTTTGVLTATSTFDSANIKCEDYTACSSKANCGEKGEKQAGCFLKCESGSRIICAKAELVFD